MNKKVGYLIKSLLPLFFMVNILVLTSVNSAITYDSIHHGYFEDPYKVITWGGDGNETDVYSTVDSFGNTITTFYSDSYSASNDTYIVKFNYKGEEEWNVSLNIADATKPVGIYNDASNNVYVAGQVLTEAPGPVSNLFILKYNANGSVFYNKFHNDINNDEVPTGMSLDNDGNIFIVGKTNNTAGDIFIHKFDNDGDHVLTRYYGNTSPKEALNVGKIAIDSAGDLYIAASTNATTPSNIVDQVLIKLNFTAGISYWNTTFGSSSDMDAGLDVAISDGNVFLTGHYYDNITSDFDAVAVNINATTGSIIWSSTFDFDNDYSNSIAVNLHGNPVISGVTDVAGNMDIFVVEFNQTGHILWNTTHEATTLENQFDTYIQNEFLYVSGSQYVVADGSFDVIIIIYEENTELLVPAPGPYGMIFGIIIGVIVIGFTATMIVLILYTYWKK
ncbi:MAG: hypothetical protein FK733_16070 [Asgard group archaeon]|nr:hypothetical protein [Asgard group archaeon]